MSRIGTLDTRIQITKRSEIGEFSNDFSELSGGTTGYKVVLETWAEVTHLSTTSKFNGRAVGKNGGDIMFKIRNPNFEIEKDYYINAKGYKYKAEGTMPSDNRHRFIIVECTYIGKDTDEG
tara:strand:- start:444 stop:806 length:363 start_codon:yes stop_codon:yes gene_type:complete